MNSLEQPSKSEIAQQSYRATWLIGFTGLLLFGFAVICGSVLFDMRRANWELARQASENLVATIEADISRNLELYELSLQAVVDGMKLPEINQINKHLRQLILFEKSATAKHFGEIQIMDEMGRVTIDSGTLDPLPSNNAQEDYFEVHKHDPNVGLFISRPVMRANEDYVVVLSRRLSWADRSFRGVVAGTIRLSFFQDLFARVDVGVDGVLTLARRDGTILMRSPYDSAFIGMNVGQTPLARHVLVRDRGYTEGVATVDGIERLNVWRAGKRHPFVVSTGRSLRSVYAGWRSDAMRIGGAMFALIVLAAGLSIWLAKELKRRASAEARLTAMAMTDSLTGLYNRRRFDEVLQLEWNRCLRLRKPLAVLMIDADHFKSFNDKFGHPAGDVVLSKLASCINSSIRIGAGDHSARYGGEEFVVLLPGLSHNEAFLVGERIRKRVQDSSRKGLGSVTVSIGVTALLPNADVTPNELVASGDAALYQAKSRGRNQTYPAPQQAARIFENRRSSEIIKLVG